MDITYTQQGDYLLPNLTLPEQDNRPIGLWGQQHLRYIKRSRPILYTNLLTKCKLSEYLADIDEQAQKMYDEKSKAVDSSPKPKTMDGVKHLMEQMKADGLKIVIVTGSGHRSLLDDLENRFPGLIDPEMMVTSYDVEHGKPHPEPYQTIVVENAPLGVRSAKAAGAFTIAVNTGPLPKEALLSEGADMLFDRMTDLDEQWKNIKN